VTHRTQTQLCAACGQEKPLIAFYKARGAANGRMGTCKECHKAYSRDRYRRGVVQPPLSTDRARVLLERHGIPCLTGAAIEFPGIDLSAWGCIPIEAKGCTVTEGGQCNWSFTVRQGSLDYSNVIFMFLANPGTTSERVFVVPGDRDWVVCHVRAPGKRLRKRKSVLAVTLDSYHGNSLWSTLEPFENAYHLIEHARQSYAHCLLNGAVNGESIQEGS
jgi:hypothetical protein